MLTAPSEDNVGFNALTFLTDISQLKTASCLRCRCITGGIHLHCLLDSLRMKTLIFGIRVGEIKSFTVTLTCAAGILSATKGDSSKATRQPSFFSSLSSENVLITVLQGEYQHRHPVNPPERAHQVRIKGGK